MISTSTRADLIVSFDISDVLDEPWCSEGVDRSGVCRECVYEMTPDPGFERLTRAVAARLSLASFRRARSLEALDVPGILSRLDQRSRAVVERVFLEGVPQSQVARERGMSPQRLNQVVLSAIDAIRRRMPQGEPS
jgi:DNA-directed RNA polymerase specialized sigma24 family protein